MKETKNGGFCLESKIARMNQQIILEMKKLRQLQIASVTQSERGHLLAFAIIAITIKVIIIVGIIFTQQGITVHFRIRNYNIVKQ